MKIQKQNNEYNYIKLLCFYLHFNCIYVLTYPCHHNSFIEQNLVLTKGSGEKSEEQMYTQGLRSWKITAQSQ